MNRRPIQERPLRKAITNLLLMVASIAISCLSAEYLYRRHLRDQWRVRLTSLPASDWMPLPDSPRVFSLYPNHEGHGRFADNPTASFAYHTNSDGLRGPAVGLKTDPSLRILAVGDSYTFGWAVEEGEDYPRQLQGLLRTRGCSAEVINGGIPGYNTEQEFYLLAELMPKYRPDVVVLAYVMNDAEPQGNIPSSPDVIYRYSHFWLGERLKRFINDILPWSRAVSILRAYENVPGRYLEGFAPESPKWRKSEFFLEKIALLCRERSADIVLVILPDFTQPFDQNYKYGTIHQAVSEWGTALGLTTIDFLSIFRGQNPALLRVIGDGHPNALAYSKIANIIAQAVIAKHACGRGS